MDATVRDLRLVEEEEAALGIISNKEENQNNLEDIAPLISSLEILRIFEDEAKEEGDGVTDAISIILQLLGEELEAAR